MDDQDQDNNEQSQQAYTPVNSDDMQHDTSLQNLPTAPTVASKEKTNPKELLSKKVSKKNVLLIVAASLFGLVMIGYFVLQTFEPYNNAITSTSNSTPSADEQAAEATSLQLFRSEYHLKGTSGCPELGNFIDVSLYDGPGDDNPNPNVSVKCSDNEITVSSNNIPHTEFVQLTPNNLEAFDYSWTIPRNPEIADEVTEIGRSDGSNPTLGDLGFAINGVAWYGPTEAEFPDPYGDPVTNSIVDDCGGHHSPYHYHKMVTKCFFPDWTEDQPAPIVGYALDGFPIYGTTGCFDAACEQIVEFKSSYNVTGDLETYAWDNVEYVPDLGEEYLDECNGRIQPDGSYGYHITSTFPYIIGCFKGTPADQTGAPDGDNPEQLQPQGLQPPEETEGPPTQGPGAGAPPR